VGQEEKEHAPRQTGDVVVAGSGVCAWIISPWARLTFLGTPSPARCENWLFLRSSEVSDYVCRHFHARSSVDRAEKMQQGGTSILPEITEEVRLISRPKKRVIFSSLLPSYCFNDAVVRPSAACGRFGLVSVAVVFVGALPPDCSCFWPFLPAARVRGP
jgi:hypothetical protein